MVPQQRSSPVGRWEGSWLAGPALWAPPTLFWLPAPHLRPILDLLEGLLCEGRSWVLAQGQQSWPTRMKGFGVCPSKALGKLTFFPCSRGSVTPRHSFCRPKGPGCSLGLPAPSVAPGHMPQDRPPGEGGCGCQTRGRLGSGVNVTLCPLSLCVCLHSAPHCLIPLSPERWAASPPSVHAACGGCSCHQGLPEVRIKGPCPWPCSEVLCILKSKEMPELNLKIV